MNNKTRVDSSRLITSLIRQIADEEAFADDVAWFAADTDEVGELATAEALREIVRTRRAANLMIRARLMATSIVMGL